MNARKILNEKNEQIKYIRPDMMVSEALDKLRSDNSEAQIVSYSGYSVLGVACDEDIRLAVAQMGSKLLKVNVRQLMHPIITTGFESDDVYSMIDKMEVHKTQYLPIITKRGHYRGIISYSDLAQYLNPSIYLKFPVVSQNYSESLSD
jgi:predicted transcriptional regulator